MSSLGRSTPPREPCITLPAVITPRGTAYSLPSMTSAMSSLYAEKLSLFSLSYQTCASRYFSFGPSSAPAHLRTRLSAAPPSQSRSRSAIGRSWKDVTLIRKRFPAERRAITARLGDEAAAPHERGHAGEARGGERHAGEHSGEVADMP